jgi:hypothetical protein
VRCSFTDQIRQGPVAGVTPGLHPQGSSEVVGDGVPVEEEAAGVGFEEHIPGQVQRELVVV